MFIGQPSRRMSERQDIRSTVHIPMVYESVEPTPVHWEYHVLSVDTRETALPDTEQLNALGKEGWILAGMLDERRTSAGMLVYYYFVRQATA